MQSSAQSMEKITCSPTRNHLYHEPNGGSLRGEAGEGRGGEGEKSAKGTRERKHFLSFSPNPLSLFPPFPSPLRPLRQPRKLNGGQEQSGFILKLKSPQFAM